MSDQAINNSTYKCFLKQLFMAVGAVWSEPVSGPISLFYREKTGNFVDSASNRRDRSLLTH